jgi:hypothetical protein
LISLTTEAYETPHSLLFNTLGTHFLSGSNSQISLFDLSRPGQSPVTTLPTIPSKRKKLIGGGVGFKGIISALSISNDGVLATGTFTRHVGLYDSEGSGGEIASFSIAGTGAESSIGGRGVTQVLWSSDSRYLYIAERGSEGILVYDIRVTGQLVGWLSGRNAHTMQRLHVSLATSQTGEELWAGGLDGRISAWRTPHLCVPEYGGKSECETESEIGNGAGGRGPDWVWEGHEGEFWFFSLAEEVRIDS